MSRYRHTFPQTRKPRHNYAKLFTIDEVAQSAYNRDRYFRIFVSEWNKDLPELFSWSLADFYKAYKNGGYQLSLSL